MGIKKHNNCYFRWYLFTYLGKPAEERTLGFRVLNVGFRFDFGFGLLVIAPCVFGYPTTSLVQSSFFFLGVPLATVKEALNHFNTCPAQLILVMKKLLRMPAPDVWQFSELLVSQIKEFMRPEVNQMLSLLFGKLWFHMNGVFPRKLWTLTVNYMNHVVNG